jgi:TonB family protein
VTANPKRTAEVRSFAPVSAVPRPLVALTDEAALAATLEELSTFGIAVSVVDDGSGLIEALLVAPQSIALIDAAACASPVEELVDSLATQFPDTRLLVAGNSLDQGLLATRIASQRVYRFVHKPASAQRLKLFYDAASRPADAARTGATTTVEVLRVPGDTAAGGGGLLGRGNSRALMMAAAAAALLVAGAAWLFHSPAKPVAEAAAPVAKARPTDALVQRADQAFAQSNFIGTQGTSASELYQQALAAAPDDARARSGYTRSIEFGLRSIEDALTLGQLDAAEQRIAAIRKIAPRTSSLDFLASQLTRAREQLAGDANRKSALDGRQTQLRNQLQDGQDALRRGAVLEPADDNAVLHLRNAERIAPGDAQVLALRSATAAKLVSGAETELAAGQIAASRRLLDAAVILGADTGVVDRLRRQADRQMAESAAAAAAAARAAAAAAAAAAPEPAPTLPAPEPAPVADAAVKKADPAVVPASALKRVRTAEPEYPSRALLKGISGWVEMEFTVQTDGWVRDVRVRQAEPAGTFDTAAVDAMRHWRFAPVLKDGKAVEQRAWIRMRFTAQKD